MGLVTVVKTLSISAGLYRPARWLSRRVRPADLREHRGNIALYRSLIPVDALVFDVGANVGGKSEAFLAAGARVIAFEPNPDILPELLARCSHNKRWTLVTAALGAEAAIATLYSRRSSGQSGLAEQWEGEVIATHHVPVVTLDAALRAFGNPVYCKIDVEGWELEVLKGLTEPIPLLSFEFHNDPSNLEKTVTCLRRLDRNGPAVINIVAGEGWTFRLREWVPLHQFLNGLAQDPTRSLEGASYGDIFVRSLDQAK